MSRTRPRGIRGTRSRTHSRAERTNTTQALVSDASRIPFTPYSQTATKRTLKTTIVTARESA